MAGSGVTLYATTAAGNKAIVGTIDWREDVYMPSQINDNLAQIMADIRAMANAIGTGWIEIGDTTGTYTATYVSATSFRFDGVDVTAYYRAGMRVRVVAPTPGTLSGTITSSVFSTHTTLVVAWDSGALSNEAITSVSIGVGSGDTTAPPSGVFTQCSLAYSNITTVQLQRSGGMQLTIDNVPQAIPAAGVNFTVTGALIAINPLYVYARMTAGVMSLEARGEAPVVDARNGLPVHPTDTVITLVGQIYVSAGPSLLEDGSNQAVSSYWDRKMKSYFRWQSNTTTSGSLVPLHNPITFLTWSDASFSLTHSGYVQLNAAGTTITQVLLDGAGPAAFQVGYHAVANGQVPTSPNFAYTAANGKHTCQLGGYVSGGAGPVGTWTGMTHVQVMG